MFRNKFFNFLSRYFDALESFFIVVLSVAFLLFINTVKNSHYLVYCSLGLLALLYWLMAIRPFEKKVAGIRIAIRRTVFVSYLLSCLSILASLRFDYEVEPKPLIIASLAFSGVALVLLLIKKYKMKEPEKFYPHLIRIFIFAVILSWLLIMVF